MNDAAAAGASSPSALPPPDAEEMLRLYRQMALIRRVEELAAKAYTRRLVRGFLHLYIGQEAVAVGAAAATRPEDWWIAAYREHGHAIAKGTPAREVMAELFGREAGTSRGRGGSMHLFDERVRFLGGHGIVGGHVPLANGVAWAIRARGGDEVVLCFFGDGAVNQGAFFEALAIAQLHRLPVVFVCENNGYAMGTPLHRHSAVTDLSVRALGVGMARDRLGGFDVVEVRDAVARAAAHARSGDGPVFLEVLTYRYRGHSMSDPAKYRPPGELEEMKRRDPLDVARRRLREELGVAEDRIAEVDAEVEAAAQDAWRFAEEAPEPDPSTLYEAVYAPQRTSLEPGAPPVRLGGGEG